MAEGRRGQLRIYLGAAPGVGKTYAMLNEGRRRHERGADVVVGFVESHGRVHTAEQVGDLEVVPRRELVYRGARFGEMDIDAVLARRPQVALVDELAHSNVPGSRNAKRWQDVDELLGAGVDVISTLNIQHLESLNDVVEQITGVRQGETVPDEVVRRADQIELVDMTPEALRRRLAHGNVYAADKIDAALAHYFRPGNLAALRELALLWVADRVEEALDEYRERHGILQPWETKERIVVALTGAPGGDHLVRRAARMAARLRGELLGVHVRPSDGLAAPSEELLERHVALLRQLGGSFQEVSGDDVAGAVVAFARGENATQLVLGASRRSRLAELVRGSIVNRVIRESGGALDVHVVSHDEEDGRRGLGGGGRPSNPIPPRRRALGWSIAVAGLPVLTVALTHARSDFRLQSVLLLYLLLVVAVAATGGLWPAALAAVAGSLLVNWYFTPPIHTWTIAEHENVLALIVFLVVAAVVSAFVTEAARRAIEASRARAEAEALAGLAAATLEPDPLRTIARRLRETFGLDAVAVLVAAAGGGGWTVLAADGERPPADPDDGDVAMGLGQDATLAARGGKLSSDDRRVLNAFTAQLAGAVAGLRLRRAAADAEALVHTDELRTALLAAVSHDLRTPLASIKASVTSLRQGDVDWTPEATGEFLATIEEETDRLNLLVGNLLDLSRIRTGVLQMVERVVGLEEVVAGALASLGDAASAVKVDVPETLPRIRVDAALLERAVANLVANAVEWSPRGEPVVVEASALGARVELRVVDRGPGIPEAERDHVFQPFQRLGDRSSGGVGLGLAVAQGFVEAVGGTIEIEDTPGGGLTMVVSVPVAEPEPVVPEPERERER